MSAEPMSFLTPYWAGPKMMRLHLASIRRFHPAAPILVSKRGGGRDEMDAYRREFGVRYWLEDCLYQDAHLRLLQRCETQYACFLDHDAILLSGLDSLLEGLREGRYDLVGVEERITEAPGIDWGRIRPEYRGWLRFAPGCVASNFILFDWRSFRDRWGLRGVIGGRTPGVLHFEFDHGIGQRLPRHRYLRPFHAPRYGMGNLLKDGANAVAWHQWYGAFRHRMDGTFEAHEPGVEQTLAVMEGGEAAFLADYPDLDLSGSRPAWGPDHDIRADQLAFEQANRVSPAAWLARLARRVRRWPSYGARGLARRVWWRLDRWRRMV